jgi:purine nucleosidase
MDKKVKIVLDVDTGVDDALAIILLYNIFRKNILGITTCGGNVGVKQTTDNTLAVLSVLNARIPVYQGSAKPLKRKSYIPAFDYHGKNGLADLNLPVFLKKEKKDAVSFISESIKKYGNNLVIISVAPPTNLAKAFNKNKKLSSKIKAVYLMGGAFNVSGNQTAKAEFNFFQDPEAVVSILKIGMPVFIVPLDVTGKCLIKKSDLVNISQNKTGVFVLSLIKNWYKIFGDKKERYFELYDPLTIVALKNNLLLFKKSVVNIGMKGKNRGAIIKGKFKINFAFSVNNVAFLKFFLNNIK